MNSVWSGDWKSRVRERVRHVGFRDLWEFARANPGVPFGRLFEQLRSQDSFKPEHIAYIQVQAVYFEDAAAHGSVREALMDTLVRRLRQHLAKGWNVGKRNREQKIEVVGRWEYPPEEFDRYVVIRNKIWSCLNEMAPADRWCPQDIDDPLIQAAFAAAWPGGD